LAEIKHQEESKLQHTEPQAHTKLLHATLHQENRRAPVPPTTGVGEDVGKKEPWYTAGRKVN
jgi:hypothetical protein